MTKKTRPSQSQSQRSAYSFIILMGLVSLFGDVTYEGARSITGPFLQSLGANAVMVGLIAGLGEFAGYALRLLSGYLADRSRAYWPLTIAGYGLILAIPLLAFAGNWQIAAVFITLERMGKAVRSPARDAILSHATKQVGRGWGFGLHEALDQIGAFVGPLIFTAVLLLKGNYSQGFTWLWLPAAACLSLLLYARRRVPEPEKFEAEARLQDRSPQTLPKVFWIYLIFIFLTVAGFANFQLLSFHFKVQGLFTEAYIPLLYALATGVDALTALAVGKLYDRIGLGTLISLPLLSVGIPFLGFSSQVAQIIFAVVLWGAAMAVHETVMRAAIADLAPLARRGFAYGVFNTAYGLAWLAGGVLLGWCYGISYAVLGMVVVGLQLAALAVYFWARRAAGV
jgi:MFS family permease